MKRPNKKWKKQKAEELTVSFKGKTFSSPEAAEQFLFRKVQSVIDDTINKAEELNDRDKTFDWK